MGHINCLPLIGVIDKPARRVTRFHPHRRASVLPLGPEVYSLALFPLSLLSVYSCLCLRNPGIPNMIRHSNLYPTPPHWWETFYILKQGTCQTMMGMTEHRGASADLLEGPYFPLTRTISLCTFIPSPSSDTAIASLYNRWPHRSHPFRSWTILGRIPHKKFSNKS